MKKSGIDIFQYHDYRLFLKDWFDQGRLDQSLSLRDVAAQCGLSTGYLPMVLSQKRNLTEKALLKLQLLLQLNQDELSYFKNLVILSDATKAPERLAAFEQLKKLRNFRQQSTKELEVYNYLTNWINVTIREMAFRNDFEANAEWILKRMVNKVPLKDVQSSLDFLLDQGFLIRDSSGVVTPSEKQLDCFSGVYRLSLGEFHRQMFELASRSIDTTPREQRNLLGHTFLIPEDKIETLRMILNQALEQIENLSSGTKESGPVYHVSLATFPVAKKGEV